MVALSSQLHADVLAGVIIDDESGYSIPSMSIELYKYRKSWKIWNSASTKLIRDIQLDREGRFNSKVDIDLHIRIYDPKGCWIQADYPVRFLFDQKVDPFIEYRGIEAIISMTREPNRQVTCKASWDNLVVKK